MKREKRSSVSSCAWQPAKRLALLLAEQGARRLYLFLFHSTKKSHMYGALIKSICKIFLEIGVIFRDESNDGN